MQIRGNHSTILTQLHSHVINELSVWTPEHYRAHYWLRPHPHLKEKKNQTVPATVSRVFRPQVPSLRSALMSTSLLCKSQRTIDPLHVGISRNKHLHKWSRVRKVEERAVGGRKQEEQRRELRRLVINLFLEQCSLGQRKCLSLTNVHFNSIEIYSMYSYCMSLFYCIFV